jgi:hypothetical protein
VNDWACLESPLKPVLDPRVYVEPKDKGTESEHARQWAWIRETRKHAKAMLAYAIRNGANIPTRVGRQKASQEGLCPGFPDTGALWAGGSAYLEWKDATGTPDDRQIERLNQLVTMGHACAIVRTAEAANRWLVGLGAPVAEHRA